MQGHVGNEIQRHTVHNPPFNCFALGPLLDDGPILKGSMVGGQMVLIDRAKKTVYSALHVDEHGQRQQVGTLDDASGAVQLWPIPQGTKVAAPVFVVCAHVSKPAGTFSSTVLDRSNIMLE